MRINGMLELWEELFLLAVRPTSGAQALDQGGEAAIAGLAAATGGRIWAAQG